jgi:hypothetical protein
MPDLSGWTQGHPSGTSRLRDFPGGYRSDKSFVREAWEEEHYFEDGSAGSAGVHKLGSGKLRADADLTASPSVGTNIGEITRGETTGRLYYTGSDVASPPALSTGTAFQFVVVGPQSLDTSDAWVMSYRTAELDAHSDWFEDASLGPFRETPFVFFSLVTQAVAGSHAHISTCSSLDSSGGTFGGWSVQINTLPQSALTPAEYYVNVLSIGRAPRSRFS